jgi:hypothetical protein
MAKAIPFGSGYVNGLHFWVFFCPRRGKLFVNDQTGGLPGRSVISSTTNPISL